MQSSHLDSSDSATPSDRVQNPFAKIMPLERGLDTFREEVEEITELTVAWPATFNTSTTSDPLSLRKGMKRKGSASPSLTHIEHKTYGSNDHKSDLNLADLADHIGKTLDQPAAKETIQLCGAALLLILADQPQIALDLAYEKLHAWPYAQVPTCWRRLFEDASLWKAVKILRARISPAQTWNGANKRRVPATDGNDENWISELVTVLDKGIMFAGAPGRKDLFESILHRLDDLFEGETYTNMPTTFAILQPSALKTQHPVHRATRPLSFEVFQDHLNEGALPMIMPGTLSDWPAVRLWHHPEYLLRRTLGGRRLVPVEIGRSYTEEGWAQKIMSIREFVESHLLNEHPVNVGYLAQHDLFTQIPALKQDVLVPDYCYTTPPPATGRALNTAGVTKQLDEPLLNAWLGPKGTKTPLHTDPYHNILCQVVGYKYVRLYAPEQTPNLYPRSTDEDGINMENTSQVDVARFRKISSGDSVNLEAVETLKREFPLVEQASYDEAILAPGECLYIPLGWWHYVESLSTSFSVSFWWN